LPERRHPTPELNFKLTGERRPPSETRKTNNMTPRQEIERRLKTLHTAAAIPEPSDELRSNRRLFGYPEVTADESAARAARLKLPAVKAELAQYNARHPHFTTAELEEAKTNLREIVRLLAKLRADKNTAESNLAALRTKAVSGDPTAALVAEDDARRAKAALEIVLLRLELLATALFAEFRSLRAGLESEVDRLRQASAAPVAKGLIGLGYAACDLDALIKRHPSAVAVVEFQQHVDSLLLARPSFSQGEAGMQFVKGTRAEAVLASINAHEDMLAKLKAIQPAELHRVFKKPAA